MTSTVSQPATKKTSTEETLLTPRFYTTDFDAIANMDISSQEEELKAMIAEMKTDYNRDHFLYLMLLFPDPFFPAPTS